MPIFVDTEPKVVQSLSSSHGKKGLKWFRESDSFCEMSGRGNNWAMGYFGPRRRKRDMTIRIGYDQRTIIEKVLDRVRKRVGFFDVFEGIIVFHSTGGGTGSGAQSY
jgi:hypothetical protein